MANSLQFAAGWDQGHEFGLHQPSDPDWNDGWIAGYRAARKEIDPAYDVQEDDGGDDAT